MYSEGDADDDNNADFNKSYLDPKVSFNYAEYLIY